MVQSAMSLGINLLIYLAIYRLMKAMQSEVMQIDDFSMMTIILISSFALLPAVFYPLHYLIKNEWGSFDNMLKVWPFQLIVNGLCLVINYFILSKRK